MTRDNYSIKDVYEIAERLEGKLDVRLTKLEERTNRLEGAWNRAIGSLAVFASFASIISAWVWDRLTK